MKNCPNVRDCEHGRMRGKCADCDCIQYEKELEQLRMTYETCHADKLHALKVIDRMEDEAKALRDALIAARPFLPQLDSAPLKSEPAAIKAARLMEAALAAHGGGAEGGKG